MTNVEISFKDLGLSPELLEAIAQKGYEKPSPIQAGVIPLLLNGDKDIVGQAATGTGKTAAFGLPLLDRLDPNKAQTQSIIMTPTRELAIQIANELKSFAVKKKFSMSLLYGGQSYNTEIAALRRKPQIIIGTPWRIKDHLAKKRLDISKIDYFVLDEADEMLNVGFKEDIEEILETTPSNKKTLLFSATMPKSIKDIVNKYIKDHDLIAIERKELTNPNIKQMCYKVNGRDKFEALCRVIEVEFDFYGIIFCRTKADVDTIAANLMTRGYKVEGIHGDIDQKMREKTLARFKNGAIKILIATDVAARWIDVNSLTHVVNYSLPDNPEVYTHRIWRTGRAGNKGTAISFVDRKDSRMLSWIERTIKMKLVVGKLPQVSDVIEFKKKRLLDNTKEVLSGEVNLTYIDLADQLLELWDANKVLASVLKEGFWNEFSEIHYKDISMNAGGDERGRSNWVPAGEKRLFIAKWRLDNYTPGSLIQFLEGEVGIKLWDIGKIDVMREFSFMNVKEEDAFAVLDFFKAANPQKPLVVEAKSSGGSSRGWDRRGGWWSRGWYRGGNSRGGSRGGYRGNSSRGWDSRGGRSGERRSSGRRS